MSDTSYQSLFPYGLRSLVECINRATILSQPTDIPSFIVDYLTGLDNFRRSQITADLRINCYLYQELWGKL